MKTQLDAARADHSLEHLDTQLAPVSQRPSTALDQLTTQVRRPITGLGRSPVADAPPE